MSRNRFEWLAFVALLGSAGQLLATPIVIPNANASTPGDTDNRFPFLVSGGMRYQQVFASSQFPGPVVLTEIDLRNGILTSAAFTSTISSILISLSTTSAAPDALSTTFASNIGANNTQVFNGSLTLSSANGPGPGDTHAFDIIIPFQTPFSYNPANGNLLLNVTNNSGANGVVGGDFFDAVNVVDSVSRVVGPEGMPGATTGTADTLGLIVQFQTAVQVQAIPEPATLILVGLGLVALGSRRRRTR